MYEIVWFPFVRRLGVAVVLILHRNIGKKKQRPRMVLKQNQYANYRCKQHQIIVVESFFSRFLRLCLALKVYTMQSNFKGYANETLSLEQWSCINLVSQIAYHWVCPPITSLLIYCYSYLISRDSIYGLYTQAGTPPQNLDTELFWILIHAYTLVTYERVFLHDNLSQHADVG